MPSAGLAELLEVDLLRVALLHLHLLLDVDRELGRHPAHVLRDVERLAVLCERRGQCRCVRAERGERREERRGGGGGTHDSDAEELFAEGRAGVEGLPRRVSSRTRRGLIRKTYREESTAVEHAGEYLSAGDNSPRPLSTHE